HESKGELLADRERGWARQIYVTVGNQVVGMTPEVLDSYDYITANSNFTREWIRRLWHRESELVYSSCEDMGPAGVKEKIILHVGRIVSEGRSDYKHQLTLL